MPCEKNNKTCGNVCETNRGGIDYLIVIVLYILLVIILSACLHY